MLASIALFAQAAPSSDPGADPIAWALNLIKWMVEQFQAHNYAPAVGAAIMLAVWLARKLIGDRLPAKALPWVSMGLGMLFAMGAKLTALAMGMSSMDIIAALVSGAMAGFSASGMWSMFGKHVDAAVAPAAPADPPADPPAPPAP